MVKQSFVLDPNAQSYTDDEIVGKVNTATAQISRADAINGAALGDCDSDDLSEGAANFFAGISGADFVKSSDTLDDVTEGSTNKHLTSTKDTKLTGIEDNATTDQTGAEVRDLIKGLSDTEREIVLTDPQSGEYTVIAIQRDSTGKLKVEYDDVAEP